MKRKLIRKLFEALKITFAVAVLLALLAIGLFGMWAGVGGGG